MYLGLYLGFQHFQYISIYMETIHYEKKKVLLLLLISCIIFLLLFPVLHSSLWTSLKLTVTGSLQWIGLMKTTQTQTGAQLTQTLAFTLPELVMCCSHKL